MGRVLRVAIQRQPQPSEGDPREGWTMGFGPAHSQERGASATQQRRRGCSATDLAEDALRGADWGMGGVPGFAGFRPGKRQARGQSKG
jgi:hypothetical protein